MMLRTVHFPVSYDPAAAAFTAPDYGVALSLLRDVLENCVVVTDPGGNLVGDLAQTISRWPPPYLKPAQQILVAIKHANRFVGLPLGTVGGGAGVSSCAMATSVSNASTPELTVIPSTCSCPGGHSAGVVNPSTLVDYPLSTFYADRRDLRRLSLGPREKTIPQIESLVWKPILRAAHSITLIDRYIGRHLEEQLRNSSPGSPLMIKPSYERSLDWMLGLFANNDVQPSQKQATVIAGIKRGPANRIAATMSAVLRAWARSRSQRFGFPVRMDVRSEKPDFQIPHERYLITDQAAWHVDAGFELLYADGSPRALTISTCSTPETMRVVTGVSAFPPPFP